MDVHNIRAVDEREELVHRGVEAAVEGFQYDRSVGLGQLRQFEEEFSLGLIVDRRLLEQDMLASADGADGPFIMEAVRQGNENGVDVGVVKDI